MTKPRHPEKINKPYNPIKKKPSWIRSKVLDSQTFFNTKAIVNKNNLHRILTKTRELSPNKVLIVDANEAFNIDDLKSNADLFVKTKIDLIEQPLLSENDNELKGLNFPISLCADESFHDSSDLAKVAHKYNTINIKLDKTGGLSEAVKIVEEAKKLDLKIMLGCMVSSSLSMLPLLPLYKNADFIDLDGPCFIANDRKNGLIYENGMMLVKEDLCWG